MDGATIAPVIIATDKTQLTQFSGSKQAYPVYLTIGNLPAGKRRKPTEMGAILLAYLSTDKLASSTLTAAQKQSKLQELFHESMRHILEPLIEAGKTGVPMTSADGKTRSVHPILACYVADYPEQCLVTTAKSTTCPKCYTSKDDLGHRSKGKRRTTKGTLDSIDTALRHKKKTFHTVCQEEEHLLCGHVQRPFWSDLPYCDIHLAITPDVLHQLYGGMLKYIIDWCQKIVGKAELDERLKRFPPAHGYRLFKKGFSQLFNISGPERKQMAKVLLGAIHGAVPKEVLAACRALLDFTYLAQYSSQSEDTLQYLEDALETFHNNKHIFVDVDIRKNFNFPKLHSLLHYTSSIRLFGTTGNYNTEMFERLHIEFAKKAFRASNKRDERPQMLRWLDKQERVAAFKVLLEKRHNIQRSFKTVVKNKHGQPFIIAKNCPRPNQRVESIEEEHSIPWLSHYLKVYLRKLGLESNSTGRRLPRIEQVDLPFSRINVWDVVKLQHADIQGLDKDSLVADAFRAAPTRLNAAKKTVPARFDTVVVDDPEWTREDDEDAPGLEGTLTINILLIE